jgi:ribonucleoside-diphosphate reductase alpha chain
MSVALNGFMRKLHHTRYARKALDKEQFLNPGQPVVVLTKDGKYPTRELGKIEKVEGTRVHVKLDSGDYETTQPGDIFVQDLHNVDILLEDEYKQTAERVAKAVASVELTNEKKIYWAQKFINSISNFLLVPAGRILNGAGDDSKVTLFNCYVLDVEKSPTAPEKGVDSRQAIFHHMGRLSEVMARGGGVGTCLSIFRPRFNTLSQTKGRSTGAVFIGNMFSGLTNFIEQANRRGAQMLTIHDWHPDVYYTNDINALEYNEDFIGAKRKPGFMEGNNSSVLVSDAFMKAVENDEMWDLKFPDTSFEKYNEEWDGDIALWEEKGYPVIVHRTVRARDMWDKIMDANHASAEPGVIFIDTYNSMANLWYLGKIKCTNPCGEQGILGNSTCNLSAINYGRMLKQVGEDAEGPLYEIDWELLEDTTKTGVHFLDNIIDLTYYFDKDMEHWQKGERREGLGGLGVADMLIALRVRYGSPEGNAILDEVFNFVKCVAYRESIELAKEKGPFPFFSDQIMASGFVQTLPQDIQDAIFVYGIRNGTILTWAPTGTTGSMTPSLLDPDGSVSTGIECHFAMKYNRKSRVGETVQYAGAAAAYMKRNPDATKLPDYFVGSMDLTPEEHVSVQSIAQKHVDSSISKTVNAPKNFTVEQVKEVYELAHKMGLKGVTIYRDGSRDEQILSVDAEETVEKPKVVLMVPLIEEKKVKGKYDDWSCGNCGSTQFHMVEGCAQCLDCGSQSCSI